MSHKMRTYSSDQALVDARRRYIARSATKVLVKKGYAQTSMRDVAQACKMSAGGIYYYVGTKEDVLYLILDHALSGHAEYIGQYPDKYEHLSATEALRQAIDDYCHFMDRTQDLVLFVYHETVNLNYKARQNIFQYEERAIHSFEKLLASGVETGQFKIDDVGLVAHDIVVLGQIWAIRRWFLRKRYTLEEYIEKETECVLKHIEVRGTATGAA